MNERQIEVKTCELCPFFSWDEVYAGCSIMERYDFEIRVEVGVQVWCPLKTERVRVYLENTENGYSGYSGGFILAHPERLVGYKGFCQTHKEGECTCTPTDVDHIPDFKVVKEKHVNGDSLCSDCVHKCTHLNMIYYATYCDLDNVFIVERDMVVIECEKFEVKQ